MDKLIEIRLTKGILILPESTLLNSLPSEIIIEGLKRGKAIIRANKFKKRIEGK